jgi:hypothetical protein
LLGIALLAFLLPASAGAEWGGAESEPNDLMAQADAIEVGCAIRGRLAGRDDVFDWYCIDFAGDAVLRGRLEAAGATQAAAPDYHITIYYINLARQAVKVLDKTSKADRSTPFEARIKQPGRYYIRIACATPCQDHIQAYFLTVDPPFDPPFNVPPPGVKPGS